MTGPAPAGGGAGAGAPAPIYTSPEEFFDLFLSKLFARNKRFKWCLQWQEHEEAAFVIKVLHDTYETTMAQTPWDIGMWLRDYAYQLFFDRLCAQDGTFTECNWQTPSHELPLVLEST